MTINQEKRALEQKLKDALQTYNAREDIPAQVSQDVQSE